MHQNKLQLSRLRDGFLEHQIAVLIVIPWLNPLAGGPAPAVQPWLVSALCAVMIWASAAKLSVGAVARAWLFAASASSLMAILQYFGQTHLMGSWIHGTNPGEAFANLRQRNHFATLTTIGLLALLWHVAQVPVACLGKSSPTTRFDRRLLWCAGALLLAVGNAISGSRTGFLQWWLVLGLSTLWSLNRSKAPVDEGWQVLMVSAFGVVAYMLALWTMPWLLEVLTGLSHSGLFERLQEDAGCVSRRTLWANVLHLIAQKPWLGWGWGGLAYAHFVTLYPGERFCDILSNAHNLPLHLAVEMGVPLAVVVCAVVLALVLHARPWCEVDATRQLAWGVLAAIGLHSLLEYPLWYGPFQMGAMLALWLLGSIEFKRPAATVWRASVAVVSIAILLFAGWDYWRVSQLYTTVAERSDSYREGTFDKVQSSWLFQDQVRFAELTTASLNAENALRLNGIAHQLLHFSPEPRVVEKLIDSAVVLGRDDEAAFWMQRYLAAFPSAYAQWLTASARYKTP